MLRTAVRSGRFLLTLDGRDYAVRIFRRLTTVAPEKTFGVYHGGDHQMETGTQSSQSRDLYYGLVGFAAVLVLVSAIMVALRRKQMANSKRIPPTVHFDVPISALSVRNKSHEQLDRAEQILIAQPEFRKRGSIINMTRGDRGSLVSFGVESPVFFATHLGGDAGNVYPPSPGASHTTDTVVNESFHVISPAQDAVLEDWDEAFHMSAKVDAESRTRRMGSAVFSADTFRDGDYVEITAALEDSDTEEAYLDVSGFPEDQRDQSDQTWT